MSAPASYVVQRALGAWGVLDDVSDSLGKWLKVNVPPAAAGWTIALVFVFAIYGLLLWKVWRPRHIHHVDPASEQIKFGDSSEAQVVRAPTRDKSLTEAAIYAASGQWGFSGGAHPLATDANDPRIEMTNRAMGMLPEIQQKAYDGDITIWGRPHDDSAAPLQIIPSDHWSTHSLNELGIALGQSQTRHRIVLRMVDAFVDLMVSSAEFEREWPHAG